VPTSPTSSPLIQRVRHAHADNGGVKIHYVSVGSGPLIVFIHGFPDFWYSWHHQMEALADEYTCVAPDLRGYNLSDQPRGVEKYDRALLIADVVAVIRDAGHEKATLAAHDWGGMLAWTLALQAPQTVEKLIIANLPHPWGLRRELATNPAQQRASQYARDFQREGAHAFVSPEALIGVIGLKDEGDRALYLEALRRSDMEAMLNYYKANYPREPYEPAPDEPPKAQMPVLMFHGLKDPYLLHGALNRTWEWTARDLTLVTVPSAGHWVHHEAADLVSQTMRWWLRMRR
jgi:pimeloyl-ACP methyl ester carboxylesterase